MFVHRKPLNFEIMYERWSSKSLILCVFALIIVPYVLGL